MEVRCAECGKPFDAKRSTARFCGSSCRVRASQRSKSAETPDPGPVKTAENREEGLVDAVKAELEAAGRLETALGRQALRLAERMGSPFDTGSAIAALSRELRAVMAEAVANTTTAADPMDELAAARARRAASA